MKNYFKAIIFAILLQAISSSVAAKTAVSIEKIDICSYDRNNKELLERHIGDAVLGKFNLVFPEIFENPLNHSDLNKNISDIVKKTTQISAEYFNFVKYKCRTSNGEYNYWSIFFLENENNQTAEFEVKLEYGAGKFNERNIPLDARQFQDSIFLAYALSNNPKFNALARNEISEYLLSSHFIFHRKCRMESGHEIEVYFAEFESPFSLFGKLYSYWIRAPRPLVYLNFDKESKFKEVRPNLKDVYANNFAYSLDCPILPELYVQQWKVWLDKNFPNSWATSNFLN